MKTQLSIELTRQYHDETLPEGDYYFECGDHIHKGHFSKPDDRKRKGAEAYNQAAPVKTITTFEGRFVGDLETVHILAPIPSYADAIALIQFAKGA